MPSLAFKQIVASEISVKNVSLFFLKKQIFFSFINTYYSGSYFVYAKTKQLFLRMSLSFPVHISPAHSFSLPKTTLSFD